MEVVLAGLNYRTAPVEIRERFTLSGDDLAVALTVLSGRPGIDEAVIVSTCNRTEIYVAAHDTETALAQIRAALCDVSSLAIHSFHHYLYMESGLEAVRHLCKVVAGLDSMVLGETQILGQVRQAYAFSLERGCSGRLLNRVFHMAVAFGKRVHTETRIGQNAVSVSYAAVALARKVFTSLADKSVLVIGAGKMSELTLSHLHSQGVRDVVVANRTAARARELASQYGGRAITLGQLSDALAHVDIVISSTGARGYVIGPSLVAEVMKRRKRRPLLCIDIAVPRDIDPELAKLSDVYVYDIDDLQDVVEHGFALRRREAERVRAMIEEEVALFSMWTAEQDVIPLIAQLRGKAQSVERGVLDSLARKLPELDERQMKLLEKHVTSVVNQLLKDPIAKIKDFAKEPGGAKAVKTFADIFGLDDPGQSGAKEVLRTEGVSGLRARGDRSAETVHIGEGADDRQTGRVHPQPLSVV